MNIAVLDAATLGEDVDLSPILSLGSVTVYPTTAPHQVAERIRDAHVAVVNKIRLNRENLPAAKDLRLICITATGYDNIDVDCCRELGIALCNVPGYSTDSVAQLSVAMALSLVNRLNEYNAFVHSGDYSRSGVANRLTPVYHELSAMTWGIVGGRAIGTRVAEVAKAFGCHVLVCRRKKDDRYEQVELDELCRRADVISLHVPLNGQTRGMISKERIAEMKPTAVFVNTARGAVTDEEALARALEEGRLGGIGVDVYSREPFDREHPFYRLLGNPRAILTPHMAWGSYEARNRCVVTVAENARRFFEGNPQNRIV